MHGFLVYFVEGAMFAGGIGLLGALLRTGSKRRSLDEERTTLEAELRLLREKRAAVDRQRRVVPRRLIAGATYPAAGEATAF